jgi:hypothetical protein
MAIANRCAGNIDQFEPLLQLFQNVLVLNVFVTFKLAEGVLQQRK